LEASRRIELLYTDLQYEYLNDITSCNAKALPENTSYHQILRS
jgi:hypothetical protein